VLVLQGVHIIHRIRNQLLYFLMSNVFLLTKKQARYKQLTDVQKLKALYTTVLIDRYIKANTVVYYCFNTSSSFFY
jgi:hypothetical protein